MDLVGVAGQAMEVRAMKTGEALQLVQGPRLVEDLCVEFDGGVGAVDTGATAGAFLGADGMGGAVRTEKEPGMATGGRRHQGLPVALAFEDGQAVEMGVNAADQDGVAVVKQVLGGDGGGQGRRPLPDQVGGIRRGDVFEDQA